MKYSQLTTLFMISLVIGSLTTIYLLNNAPQAFAAKEFCRSSTPNADGEPLEDSTQTICIDKKAGEHSFTCEGTYADIGEECGQTFETDKATSQDQIKSEREICREFEDVTCEKVKTEN